MASAKEVRFKAANMNVRWPRHPDPAAGEKFEDKTFEYFDPAKPEVFEKWVLLEVVTNFAVLHGRPASKHHTYFRDHIHPRGHAMELTKPGVEASFQRHRYLTAMAGPSFQNIQRLQRIEGSSDYDKAANFVQGKPRVFVPALVPAIHPEIRKPSDRKLDAGPDTLDSPECPNSKNFTEPDVFLWVDLTYPLRGLYLPLRLEDNNTTCVYAHFDFTTDAYDLEQYTYSPNDSKRPDFVQDEPDLPLGEEQRQATQEIKRATGWVRDSMTLGKHPDLGWDAQPKWTARFDVENLKKLVARTGRGKPTDYIKLFDSEGILIRIGGNLKIRVDKAYNDPVHTMNDREVVDPIPKPF